MTLNYFLTTTGTVSPVVIAGLGSSRFPHPTVDFNLNSDFSFRTIESASDELNAAIANGSITVADSTGRNITDMSNLDVSEGGTPKMSWIYTVALSGREPNGGLLRTWAGSGNQLPYIAHVACEIYAVVLQNRFTDITDWTASINVDSVQVYSKDLLQTDRGYVIDNLTNPIQIPPGIPVTGEFSLISFGRVNQPQITMYMREV